MGSIWITLLRKMDQGYKNGGDSYKIEVELNKSKEKVSKLQKDNKEIWKYNINKDDEFS